MRALGPEAPAVPWSRDGSNGIPWPTPLRPVRLRASRLSNSLESCRVPTIAACCDLRLGAASARFGFPIARTLGNGLSLPNLARLSALIGPARVKDMIFTARLIEADEALRIGLLQERVDDAEELRTRADELARLIASHAPLTLQATKEALHRIQSGSAQGADHDLILMCYMSQDFREGMDAFLTKRAPDWQGR
jgi:enoyl-CoA hydratase